MTQIDLSQLPQPDLIEPLDYEDILARRKEKFVSLFPVSEQATWRQTLALESDPVTKLLEESAYMEMLLRQRINTAARATMLAYATGTDLDNIAANFNTQRLVITPADDSTNPPTPAVMESDDNLRKRCQLSFEGITTAGPIGSYRYHALSADGKVKDVGVSSPTPGQVLLSVLSYDSDGTADQALQDKVYQSCNADNVRPLCDTVTVSSARIINYQIVATLTLYPEVTESISLTAANQAINDFAQKHHKLGHDITLSGIYSALHQEGVQNVKITQPQFDIVIDDLSAGFCTNITLSVGGRNE